MGFLKSSSGAQSTCILPHTCRASCEDTVPRTYYWTQFAFVFFFFFFKFHVAFSTLLSENIPHPVKAFVRFFWRENRIDPMPTMEVAFLSRDSTWQHSYLLVFLHLQTGSVETFDSSSQWSRMTSHQNFYPWTPGNKVRLCNFFF